jgi:hypothetical protein
LAPQKNNPTFSPPFLPFAKREGCRKAAGWVFAAGHHGPDITPKPQKKTGHCEGQKATAIGNNGVDAISPITSSCGKYGNRLLSDCIIFDKESEGQKLTKFRNYHYIECNLQI